MHDTQHHLYILRHAKAMPGTAGQPDQERDLTAAGVQDLADLGAYMQTHMPVPDYVLASSAVRTARTARHIADTLKLTASMHLDAALYETTPEGWLQRLRPLAGKYRAVLIVGHNPVLEQLACMLAGQTLSLPPGGLLHLGFYTGWEQLPAPARIQGAHYAPRYVMQLPTFD